MKKILTLFTVLCMTLMFTGCTKTVKLEDIDSANFTEDILSVKCTNTLKEMMSEDFEPKLVISNNYKEGDVPYLNFDFDKKDEINDMFKAYALGYHSNKTANDKNAANGYYEEASYGALGLDIKPYYYKDRYLFIEICLGKYVASKNKYLCIDLENKKLLTGEEVLAIKNYNLDEHKDEICESILNTECYYDITDKEKIFNYIKQYSKNIETHIGRDIYDKDSYDLSKYGIITSSDDFYKSSEELINSPYDNLTYFYINNKDELILVFNCRFTSFNSFIELNLENLK